MAPPLFHSFLQKGMYQSGKLDFVSNEKVVAPYGNFFVEYDLRHEDRHNVIHNVVVNSRHGRVKKEGEEGKLVS